MKLTTSWTLGNISEQVKAIFSVAQCLILICISTSTTVEKSVRNLYSEDLWTLTCLVTSLRL